MRHGSVVVLDVGKTLAKLALWSPERTLVERRSRPNQRVMGDGYPSLDVEGIASWLEETLKAFAAKAHDIAAIVTVAHGASGCIIDKDGLCLAPLDYEADPPADVAERYRKLRDPFAVTGSPCLPLGLNFGIQLYWLDAILPDKARRGQIVTWPQYWAWRLSGIASTEVTSLGCHTDLWNPAKGCPSPLAEKQGWAARFAPLRRAADALGPVTAYWQSRCGLPKDCQVLCGVHDSNAALHAARLYPEVGDVECSVLSTGTWFIAMRSMLSAAGIDTSALPADRDCLVNVNTAGVPVPSSRFMGGREAELLEQPEGQFVDPGAHAGALIDLAKRLVKDGVMALPAFEKGVGPYPRNQGRWIDRPADQMARRAAAGLYLALMADTSLALIASRDRLVIEGRFAGDPVFTGALAALRPQQSVYLANAMDNISLGALGLIDGKLPAGAALSAAVKPLDFDLSGYAGRWRALAEEGRSAK